MLRAQVENMAPDQDLMDGILNGSMRERFKTEVDDAGEVLLEEISGTTSFPLMAVGRKSVARASLGMLGEKSLRAQIKLEEQETLLETVMPDFHAQVRKATMMDVLR